MVLYADEAEKFVVVRGGEGNWKRKLGGREVFQVSFSVCWGALIAVLPSKNVDCDPRIAGDGVRSVGGSWGVMDELSRGGQPAP